MLYTDQKKLLNERSRMRTVTFGRLPFKCKVSAATRPLFNLMPPEGRCFPFGTKGCTFNWTTSHSSIEDFEVRIFSYGFGVWFMSSRKNSCVCFSLVFAPLYWTSPGSCLGLLPLALSVARLNIQLCLFNMVATGPIHTTYKETTPSEVKFVC